MRLVIYNVLGQKIKTLVDQRLEPGNYSTVWDATDEFGRPVSAGLYLYQFQAGKIIETRKMILMDGSVGVGSKRSSTIPLVEQQKSNLSKVRALTITLRATGAPILPSEQKNIMISNQDFHFDISVNLKANTKINTDLVVISEPSDGGKVYISALAGTVIDTILGSEKITLINTETQEEISNRVDYDGGFLLTLFNASLGHEFSLTLFREGVQLGKSEQIVVESNKPPKVKTSSPTNGDKDIVIDARIFIYFSEPINTSTVNANTFTLTGGGGAVAGTIGFLDDSTIATFTPNIQLTTLTDYTIKVDTGVKNRRGIHIENTYEANFSTTSGNVVGRIAYVRFGSFNEIFVMDTDGNNRIRLGIGSNPNWTPDGTRIAFVIGDDPFSYWHPEYAGRIYLMNANPTFREKLSTDYTDYSPAISPDGTKIAYTSVRDGNHEIFIMNINGTNPVNLTNHIARDHDPTWSPDGSKIAFVSNRFGAGLPPWGKIFVMGRNGEDQMDISRNLTGLANNPTWSPDGTQIAFFLTGAIGFGRLGVVNSDGSSLTIIASDAEESWRIKEYGISWSPDGTKLVFDTGGSVSTSGITIINKDGSNLHHITYIYDSFNYNPTWLPVPIKR